MTYLYARRTGQDIQHTIFCANKNLSISDLMVQDGLNIIMDICFVVLYTHQGPLLSTRANPSMDK